MCVRVDAVCCTARGAHTFQDKMPIVTTVKENKAYTCTRVISCWKSITVQHFHTVVQPCTCDQLMRLFFVFDQIKKSNFSSFNYTSNFGGVVYYCTSNL